MTKTQKAVFADDIRKIFNRLDSLEKRDTATEKAAAAKRDYYARLDVYARALFICGYYYKAVCNDGGDVVRVDILRKE